jgi:hypothetical protein
MSRGRKAHKKLKMLIKNYFLVLMTSVQAIQANSFTSSLTGLFLLQSLAGLIFIPSFYELIPLTIKFNVFKDNGVTFLFLHKGLYHS